MAMSLSKKVNINGCIFSLGEFIDHVERKGCLAEYADLLSPLFMSLTLVIKENESIADYCQRLFYQLYYKKHFAYNLDGTNNTVQPVRSIRTVNNNVQSNSGWAILNTLGIDVVKQCKKVSKVIFKNTGNQYKMKNENIEALIASINKNKSFSFKDREIKFGIEFEFIGEYNLNNLSEFHEKMYNLVGNKRYFQDLRYNHNDGKAWVLGRDGSLRTQGSSFENGVSYGYELTSPIFTYGNEKDMQEIKSVLALVNEIFNGTCNRSCGTHVHMSFNCDKNVTSELKKYFAWAYHKNENNLFDKLVPFYRRANHNQYCRSTSPDYVNDRYRKLNLTLTSAVRETKNMHIEFRQLDGNLDFDKIEAWMTLQKLFIESTLDNFYKQLEDCTFYTGCTDLEVEDLSLEDTICSKQFNEIEIEKLMVMSKLVS